MSVKSDHACGSPSRKQAIHLLPEWSFKSVHAGQSVHRDVGKVFSEQGGDKSRLNPPRAWVVGCSKVLSSMKLN